MPTIITHAITAIPISLAFKNQISARRIIILSIIFSIVPDLDGIGFQLGIKYNSLFGHRGFSHSIFFLVITAIIFIFLTSSKIKMKRKSFLLLFTNFFSIGCLHILLDMMTNGGLGIALFSPFSNQRFFFSWRPIEVSSILPKYFFELNGLQVIKFELLYLILPSILLSTIFIFKKNVSNINNCKSAKFDNILNNVRMLIKHKK